MAARFRSNRIITLTGVLITSLCLLPSCNANVENASEHTYDPEKTIEENFFSYSQFGLYYFRRIHFFDKYFTIVLFAIGFPGNFISFLVWSSKRMYHGNSAAVYLAALSLNDTVVLAIALFRDLTKLWDVPFYPTPGSCEVLETITLTVQYASPMFVLAFTVERWLAICQPFMVSRICSVQRAVQICIAIILLTLMVCSPMAYLIGTDPLGCQPRSGAVFHFTTTLEVLYSLVTPLLVLTFNCLVINEMSKIRRSQMMKMLPGAKKNSRNGSDADEIGFFRRLFRKSTERSESGAPLTVPLTKEAGRRKTESDSGGGDASSPKFKSTTIMLLVVSFYVIIATLLGGLWYVLDIRFTIEAYAKWKKRRFDESEVVSQALRLRMIKTVCDELALSHFAMGFVLYFSTGKNFREEVRRLFYRCGFFDGSKPTRTFQSSLTNDTIKDQLSRRQSREKTKKADSTIPMTAVAGLTREKGASVKHSGLFHFKTNKRRSDFPGLDQCGHRGERQPSKLSNIQKLKTNSDPSVLT